MELIRQFLKTKVCDTTTFQFDCNHYVEKVTVILEGDFSAYKNSELIVKYGQNGITTDLIPFGSAKISDSELIEISVDTPVSASHIYVTLDQKIEIKDIMLYELNAKSLITTWGSYNQSETGGLHDYSNRQWSGLIGDFYKPRWELWVDERKKEL